MAKKAPGFYKKSLTGKKIETRYLKHTQYREDREFLKSVYTEADGVFTLRSDLDETVIARLKSLKKVIAKNRKGPVNFLPLVVAGILAAGLVFFFLVLLNPLLEKALESGLESVFEAKADAENFRVNVLKFEIALDGLTIADRDSPMRNLIQADRVAIRFLPKAVLRGKVYIEEIRADAIRFGTARSVSGALPDKAPREKPVREKKEVPALLDLENFDALALLNREYEKLETPKLYGEAIAAYEAAAARWQTQYQAAENRVRDLENRARPILNININDYKTLDPATIEQIRLLVNEISALVTSVQEAANEVNAMAGGVEADIAAASRLEQSAGNAVGADLTYLKSFLNLTSGPSAEILETVIEDILTGTAQTYLSYGERALELLEKVKAIQTKLPKSSKPESSQGERFRGRDVVFPVTQYPQFFLGVLASDVLTPSGWRWGFDLRGVSSDPDLSGMPVNLSLSLEEAGDTGRQAAFAGQADFRTNAAEYFAAELTGSGFPLSLGSLSQIGIAGFSGNASFGVDLSGASAGGFSGSGNFSIAGSRLAEPSNTLAQAVDTALTKVSSLDLGVRYEHGETGESFRLDTNIGDLVMDALKSIADQYVKKAEDEIEKILREKIASYIDESLVSREDLDTLFAVVRGDQAAMDRLRNTLESKKNEFEQKLRSAVEDAASQAVEEAKKQGAEALEDILQGNPPDLNLPSMPALPSNLFGR